LFSRRKVFNDICIRNFDNIFGFLNNLKSKHYEITQVVGLDDLGVYLSDYQYVFKLRTSCLLSKATSYISSLFTAEKRKRNIERMCEKNDENYQSQQHFITHSPWDAKEAMKIVARKANKTLGNTKKQCLLIDESSHKKAGKDSVAVSRQHNGNLGKIENSQTGVFAALANHSDVCLIRTRLFIPEVWINDEARCLKAGIPKKDIVFKTKPQLAIEMIKELKDEGVQYGWVGADALYGRNFDFRDAIADMGLKYVVDIQKDHPIYVEEPNLFVPQKPKRRIAKTIKYQTDTPLQTPEKYIESLTDDDWEMIKYRQGTKGQMMALFHIKEIYIWKPGSESFQKLTLIIRKKNNEIKYSLSNFSKDEATNEEFAYMQGQRFLVEKSFKDEKGELGLFDYQIRKYTSWYHHMALVMIAMHYTLEVIIRNRDKIPLLSVRDVRLQIIEILIHDGVKIDKKITQMIHRHKQRAEDIIQHYSDYENPS
jgi:SRSO17 transposase